MMQLTRDSTTSKVVVIVRVKTRPNCKFSTTRLNLYERLEKGLMVEVEELTSKIGRKKDWTGDERRKRKTV